MSLITWMKGVIRKMFGIEEIEGIVGEEVSLSSEMQEAMERWEAEYVDSPHWLSETVPTLGIAGGIAEELARLSLLEYEFVGAGNSERGRLITKWMKAALENVSDELEHALAVGGMFPKPYVTSKNTIGIEWIPQNRVFPISDEAGDLKGAVFVSQKQEGDIIYTRIEIHEQDGTDYTVRNYAYLSKSKEAPFSKSIELSKVSGWENIDPIQAWENVEYPMFAGFRVPGKNKTDLTSPLGESVFARAEGLMMDADTQYGRFLWEFEASEAAVHIDAMAYKSKVNADGTVTSNLPQGKERLYRLVQSVGKADDGGFFKEWAPTIRDASQINGLNQILMQIENRCHLVRGTLSNDKLSESYTNELELKLTRNRGENTSNRIQKAFGQTIVDLCMAMNTMCDVYGIAPGVGIVPEDVTQKFGDSIVQDDTTRLEQMRQDVNDGIIPKWMYIMEKYGKTEDEAKALADQGTDTSTPTETRLFGGE